MADLQKQIDRIDEVLDKLLEFHVLLSLTFGEVIPREHSEFLPGVQQPDPIIEDSVELSTRITDVQIELHRIAHTIFDNNGDEALATDDDLIYSLGFDHAFS